MSTKLKAYLVGGGIGSLAAACMIRDSFVLLFSARMTVLFPLSLVSRRGGTTCLIHLLVSPRP